MLGERASWLTTSGWYLIAGDGDVVVRVRPGMLLGEDPAGELSFDAADARLQLDLRENGGLVIASQDDYELVLDTGERRRSVEASRRFQVQIRMGSHAFTVDTDFVAQPHPGATLIIRCVPLGAEVLPEPPDTTPRRPPGRAGAHGRPAAGFSEKALDRLEQALSDTGSEQGGAAAMARARRPRPSLAAAADSLQAARSRLGPRSLRVAAVLALALALLIAYPLFQAGLERVFFSGEAWQPVAEQAPTRTPLPARQAPPREPAVAGRPVPVVAPTVTVAPAEPAADEEAAAEPLAAEAVVEADAPADRESQTAEPPAAETLVADAPAAEAPAAEAPAAETAVARVSPVEAPAAEEPADLAPIPTMDTAARDLATAQRALEQGWLVAPPGASALALYQRVLARDPQSAAAQQGLEAVQERLLARARSALDEGDAEAASEALDGAVLAGAHPARLEDLRAEARYRQELLDALAGVPGSLYPLAELTAVRRPLPRYPRFAPRGASGSVTLEMTVDEEGRVEDIDVVGEAPSYFVRAAQRTLERWRFEPVLRDGTPVSVRTAVTLTFREEEES